MELLFSLLWLLAPFLGKYLDRYFPDPVKRQRIKLLRKTLKSGRFSQGRSLETLMRRTRMPKVACQELLLEIGAESFDLHDGREGWRLKERP